MLLVLELLVVVVGKKIYRVTFSLPTHNPLPKWLLLWTHVENKRKILFLFFFGGGRSTLDINTVQRQVSKVDGSSKEKGETDLSDRLYSGRSAAAVDVDKTKTALKHWKLSSNPW